MREAQIQSAVIAHWRVAGTPGSLVAAIPNAGSFGQPGLTKGLPDLLVVGGNVGVGFIELKTETGRLSPAQRDFADLCFKHRVMHVITKGRDEPIKVLKNWGVVVR